MSLHLSPDLCLHVTLDSLILHKGWLWGWGPCPPCFLCLSNVTHRASPQQTSWVNTPVLCEPAPCCCFLFVRDLKCHRCTDYSGSQSLHPFSALTSAYVLWSSVTWCQSAWSTGRGWLPDLHFLIWCDFGSGFILPVSPSLEGKWKQCQWHLF